MIKQIITFTFAAAMLITASACRNESGRAADRNPNAFEIPALKDRPQGLGPHEFAKLKERYTQLREQAYANEKDIKACVEIAQIFMGEARVTGDHPYYYPAAERMLDEALRRDPNDLAALTSKGSVLLSLHHFSEALQMAERAKALSPTTAVIYGIICDANVELGRYEEAVRAADQMAAIRPDLRSYSRVSYLREIHGDDEGAIEAMTMAVKAGIPGAEDTEWSRYTLGNLYLSHGRLEEAEKAFRMSTALRPNYPFAIAGLARVRVAQGRNAEARALLDTAVGLIPEFSFVELQADILRATGNANGADSLIAVVEKMLGEDEAAGHYTDKEFAVLYGNHGVKAQQALARARKELERRPDNIEAQHTMALALLRTGNAAEAKQYITHAMRMGTNDAVLLAHAGLIETALGNKAEAQSLLKRAVKLNPTLPPLLAREVREAMMPKKG